MSGKHFFLKIETVNTANNWIKNLNNFSYSVFITPEWLNALADSAHTPIYLDFYSNQELVAKLAGFLCGNNKSKQLYFYSAPAMMHLNSNLLSECLNELYNYAKINGYSRIIIGSYGNNHSVNFSAKKYFKNERSEYLLDLKNGLNEVKTSSRFRRNVKKGQKVNPEVIASKSTNHLHNLKQLLNTTKSARLKKFNKDYNPFYLKNLTPSSLHNLLNNNIGHIYYIQCGDNINCMEFNIEIENKVYMLLKGSDEYGYNHGLSSYLSHFLTHKYSNGGVIVYNQGGRPRGEDGEGLDIFKKSMGAKEVIAYGATTNYITYPHKLLNPILNLGRLLPDIEAVNFFKKFI